MALLLLAWLCSGKWLYWTAEREVFIYFGVVPSTFFAGWIPGGKVVSLVCHWGSFQLEGGRVGRGRQRSQELAAQVALVGVKEEIFCGAKEGLCSIDVALCRYTGWRLLLVNLCLELHHSQWV